MENKSLKQVLADYFEGHCDEKGYLNIIEQNAFDNMPERFRKEYEEGAGQELKEKAYAAHSSSMLCYNFLSWICPETPLELNGVTYTDVHFEVKLKTIKNSHAPANLDALLIGKRGELTVLCFVESKFLEPTYNDTDEVRDGYRDESRYYTKKSKRLVSLIDAAEKACRGNKFDYGVKQGITHLFGIDSLADEANFEKLCKKYGIAETKVDDCEVMLLNLVFEPRRNRFPKEHEDYVRYHDLYTSVIKDTKIPIKWMTYGELFNRVEPDDRRMWLLQRYIKHAE